MAPRTTNFKLTSVVEKGEKILIGKLLGKNTLQICFTKDILKCYKDSINK